MWADINDTYAINVRGEVLNKISKRIMTGWIIGSKPGYYLAVWIHNKRVKIHQLVAQKWLPAPTKENCVIDHIDRNRYNNTASNLRWVSKSENATNKSIVTTTSLGDLHHIKIQKCDSNIDYFVRITINKEAIQKRFKTLEEAKEFRDQLIENSEFKKKESRLIINAVFPKTSG
jgi:hypothetical protein